MVTPRHLETGSEVQEVASVSQTWRLSGGRGRKHHGGGASPPEDRGTEKRGRAVALGQPQGSDSTGKGGGGRLGDTQVSESPPNFSVN